MDDVFISIGSNVGNRIEACSSVNEMIASERKVTIKQTSSLYETEPIGYKNQPDFINQVMKISTGLSPQDLLDFLQEIERGLGRVRSVKWGPRTMDLDLLFFGQSIIQERTLIVPHPELHKRRFVLIPLAEIAPDFQHPLLKKTVKELLVHTKDTAKVKKVAESDGIY